MQTNYKIMNLGNTQTCVISAVHVEKLIISLSTEKYLLCIDMQKEEATNYMSANIRMQEKSIVSVNELPNLNCDLQKASQMRKKVGGNNG